MFRLSALLSLLLLGGDVLSIPAAEETKELKKLHVLMAIDTASEDLEPTVIRDRVEMKKYLEEKIPKDRLAIDVIDGSRLNQESILNYYKNLRCDPNDSLLFYYSGHGMWLDKGGHILTPQGGKVSVSRAAVISAMQDKKTPLVILLTDCCSTTPKRPTKRELDDDALATYGPSRGMDPIVRSLFFQHRGLVDITAAEKGTPAWSDVWDGGIFTRTLIKQLRYPPKKLAPNYTWKDFYDEFQTRMKSYFIVWAEDMNKRAVKSGDDKPITPEELKKPQAPHMFKLPESMVKANTNTAPKVNSTDKRYAVVSVNNVSGEPITLKYRWSESEDWKELSLAADDKKHVFKMIGKDTDLPRLQVMLQIGQSEKKGSFYSVEWLGQGEPPYLADYEGRISKRKK